MKKVVLAFMLVISLLVANTSVVWAGAAIELISVTNNGGGPAFTFRVSGEFSPKDLKGNGHISGGDDFMLHCAQQDETTVICHAPGKAGGQSVSVTFGGATFWADVPEQRIVQNPQTCYNGWTNQYFVNAEIVYTNGNPNLFFTPPVVVVGLEQHVAFCSDDPNAIPPSVVQVTHGALEALLRFWPDGKAFCNIPNNGKGYYPVVCAV